MFKSNVENWSAAFGNQDRGVMSSLMQNLEPRIIPKGEHIITFGEVAMEMYFIVKGRVEIISSDGIMLAEIGVGENFGEMALLADDNVRSATVLAATDVSVAIMRKKDFK